MGIIHDLACVVAVSGSPCDPAQFKANTITYVEAGAEQMFTIKGSPGCTAASDCAPEVRRIRADTSRSLSLQAAASELDAKTKLPSLENIPLRGNPDDYPLF